MAYNKTALWDLLLQTNIASCKCEIFRFNGLNEHRSVIGIHVKTGITESITSTYNMHLTVDLRIHSLALEHDFFSEKKSLEIAGITKT